MELGIGLGHANTVISEHQSGHRHDGPSLLCCAVMVGAGAVVATGKDAAELVDSLPAGSSRSTDDDGVVTEMRRPGDTAGAQKRRRGCDGSGRK